MGRADVRGRDGKKAASFRSPLCHALPAICIVQDALSDRQRAVLYILR